MHNDVSHCWCTVNCICTVNPCNNANKQKATSPEVFISESECLRESCSDEMVGETLFSHRWTDLDHGDLFGDNETKG